MTTLKEKLHSRGKSYYDWRIIIECEGDRYRLLTLKNTNLQSYLIEKQERYIQIYLKRMFL